MKNLSREKIISIWALAVVILSFTVFHLSFKGEAVTPTLKVDDTRSLFISTSEERVGNSDFTQRPSRSRTIGQYPAVSAAGAYIGQVELQVDFVDTDISRKKGLSNRDSLPRDRGMLFIFEESGLKEFWMKDMKFPIDIIWIDESKRIVFVENAVPPSSYPEVFAPKVSAKYVLEVSAGFVEENNIKIGSEVSF